jgi:hypothetical protein
MAKYIAFTFFILIGSFSSNSWPVCRHFHVDCLCDTDDYRQYDTLDKRLAFKRWIADSASLMQNEILRKNPKYLSIRTYTGVDSENLNIELKATEVIRDGNCTDSVTKLAIQMLKWNGVEVPKRCIFNTCFIAIYSMSTIENMLYECSYEFCNIHIRYCDNKLSIKYSLVKGNLTGADTIYSSRRK